MINVDLKPEDMVLSMNLVFICKGASKEGLISTSKLSSESSKCVPLATQVINNTVSNFNILREYNLIR